jgi:hypothetical protein
VAVWWQLVSTRWTQVDSGGSGYWELGTGAFAALILVMENKMTTLRLIAGGELTGEIAALTGPPTAVLRTQ